jgi:hypothetical protein
MNKLETYQKDMNQKLIQKCFETNLYNVLNVYF